MMPMHARSDIGNPDMDAETILAIRMRLLDAEIALFEANELISETAVYPEQTQELHRIILRVLNIAKAIKWEQAE